MCYLDDQHYWAQEEAAATPVKVLPTFLVGRTYKTAGGHFVKLVGATAHLLTGVLSSTAHNGGVGVQPNVKWVGEQIYLSPQGQPLSDMTSAELAIDPETRPEPDGPPISWEIGSMWKTRSGAKVQIIDIHPHSVIGWVYSARRPNKLGEMGGTACEYHPDGRKYFAYYAVTSTDDIVGKWVPTDPQTLTIDD